MFIYSPRPIKDYRLRPLEGDETSVILENGRSEAVWNLFWMSLPTLDHVPDSGMNWWRKHQPILGALPAILEDVWGDDVLYQRLKMHPQSFCDWWEREDHSIYDTYTKLGGEAWVETVMSRGQAAAERLVDTALSKRRPVEVIGNIIRVNFR